MSLSLDLLRAALGAMLLGMASLAAAAPAAAALPQRLSETGLFQPGSHRIRAGIVPFSPQYPLWSDGAVKRRWLHLPAGKSIDASRPDAWQFPPGTKLWKEFALDGRPLETRTIERLADGSWRFASYVWREDGSDADLAPARGTALPVRAAPDGRYAVPSRGDCLACHGGAAVPVLGVSALQLSPDRDPLAVHGQPARVDDVDLRGLVARRWLRGLPAALLAQPPHVAAETPVERAALGYLHGNCGHCHNSSGNQAPVRLMLAQSVVDPLASRRAALRSAVDAPSRYRPPGHAGDATVIVPGNVQHSVLATRMQSRQAQVQMPPLGTDLPDTEGLALIHRWITSDLPHPKENQP